MFDDAGDILKGLQHFRHRRHEVIVFHLLDPQELDFPFEGINMFDDHESGNRLVVDPKAVRREYIAQLNAHLDRLMRGCRDNGIDYVRVVTSEPFNEVLTRYLSLRHG